MIKAIVICDKVINPILANMANDYGVELYPVFDQEIYNKENYIGKDIVIGFNTNIKLGEEFFKMLKEAGVDKFAQPMTGFNHLDLHAAKNYGVKCANVRAYSPNAIAELTLAMVLGQSRNLFGIQKENENLRFNRPATLFTEVRECTVGIIGVGAIGLKSAQFFNALEAKVIGYDPYPNDKFAQFGQYVDLDTLKKESDIVIIHVPYFPDSNHHMIDEKFINDLKDGAMLVNCARGELVDLKAVNKAIKANKLASYSADVLEGEGNIFGKEFDNIEEIPSLDIKEALSLYPRVIITPHIGAATVTARTNMIKICLSNVVELVNTGTCKMVL